MERDIQQFALDEHHHKKTGLWKKAARVANQIELTR